MSFLINEQYKYTNIIKKINFNNLNYHFKGSINAPKQFLTLEAH